MTTHPDGVTELLRRASDDLAPDIDRLVSGGITRGRSRQRRARIGTTVASLAVIGVVGGLAAVVPQVDGGRLGELASGGPSPVPRVDSSQTAPSFPQEPPRPLAVTKTNALVLVERILGADSAAGLPSGSGIHVAADEVVVSFLWEGTMTSLVFAPGEPGGRCGDRCTSVDGQIRLAWGPNTADKVTSRGIAVWRDGWRIEALSYNAPVGTDVPPTRESPALSQEELVELASSDLWFR